MVTNAPIMEVTDFKDDLEAIINATIKGIKRVPAGYLVQCHTEEGARRLLRVNGEELDGLRISVTPNVKQMGGDEIFEFVGERLRLF